MREGGWGTLEGLQRNRAQLFFNWVPPPTTTPCVCVCMSLLSNFPADGSEALNTLVWQQPSYETLHMGSVLVVWLINLSTNQGLWQLHAPMNHSTQSQHEPKQPASRLTSACDLSWVDQSSDTLKRFLFLNFMAGYEIRLSMHHFMSKLYKRSSWQIIFI